MPGWLLRTWTLLRAYLRTRPRGTAGAEVAADGEGVRVSVRGTIRLEVPGEEDG